MAQGFSSRLIYFILVIVGLVAVLGTATGMFILQNDPDLTPDIIDYSPIGPQTGDSVTFTSVIKNIGNGTTGSQFTVSLYIDGLNVANDTVSAIGAGSSSNATFTWTATSESVTTPRLRSLSISSASSFWLNACSLT